MRHRRMFLIEEYEQFKYVIVYTIYTYTCAYYLNVHKIRDTMILDP